MISALLKPSTTLTTADLKMFQEFGVDNQLLEAAQVHRLDNHEAKDAGFRYGGDLSGIVFPYPHFVSAQCVTARMRRDKPDLDADGKPVAKYIQRYGERPFLYFPPNAQQRLRDAQRIVIVEAEKSVLAITALSDRNNLNLLAVACGGCWGWKGRIDREQTPDGGLRDVRGPITDLNYIVTNGKDIDILFDSNSQSNPKVRTARRELASYLTALGARVMIADLPQVEGVNGPDDLIKVAGEAAFMAVLEGARLFEKAAVTEAEELIAGATNAEDTAQCITAIAQVKDGRIRDALLDKLIAKAGNRADLRKRIAREIAALDKSQKSFKEIVRQESLLRMKLDPRELLLEIATFFEKFLYAANGFSLILALWVMNTWVFDVFDTTPYLLLYSATRNCGKTTCMQLLEALSATARFTVGITTAVMYRIIAKEKPTLLIDEAECLIAGDERGKDLTHIANSGYKRGGVVYRCDTGDDFALQEFPMYCPKAFASIGKLDGPLMDRCIVMCLERAPRNIVVARAYSRVVTRLAEPIRKKLEAYAVQAAEPLKDCLESSPDQGYWPQLYGREAELFEPLLMHAKLISPEAEQQALKAAFSLSKEKQKSQAEERLVAKATGLLNILESRDGEEFMPYDIVEELEKEESWSAELERCQSRRSKAVVVGRFLHHFGLARTHTRRGAVYPLELTKNKLRAHVPNVGAE